ncbi:MAG: di-heme oxidoredictase family protein, partial [Wenzhouxiangellaceae bacterium]
YVTRVLWGIGDSDPYLHDGRARTLAEAIQLHAAEGSDAADAAANFARLSADDQQALIDFLQSLRLPVADGVAQPEYVSIQELNES